MMVSRKKRFASLRAAFAPTNGTFVNGERVENAVLESGDRIQVGRVELVALRDAD